MGRICRDCGNRRIGYRHRLRCLVGARFLKTLDETAVRKLRLPAGFVAKAKNAIGNKCFLNGPKMELYVLRVKKEGDEWSFKGGWKDFCAAYNLGPGYSVRLKYTASQYFEVEIYDMKTEELAFGMTAEEFEEKSSGARERQRKQRAEKKRAKENRA